MASIVRHVSSLLSNKSSIVAGCIKRPLNIRLLHTSFSIFSSDDVSPRGPAYTTSMSGACIPANPEKLCPIYRILDNNGKVLNTSEDPKLSNDLLLNLYENMVTLQIMDQYLYRAQRMGAISFYMTNFGEEGTHFGSAAALDPNDVVYAQYRETGVLMWRGFSLDDIMNQCFNNMFEGGKGRQMPVHYGSKALNFHYISSPLATQMPQAPGYAFGLKRSGSKNCVICYFGDGAAQEGDAHASMNFAATLGCPVIFMCRNNGYAISTPVEDQYAGDGIVRRGLGYGMEAIRVDGNDILAMYNATTYARKVCVEEHRPVLIEAMTYRLGSHSTSDDQGQYQDMEQVEYWHRNLYPATRLKLYLIEKEIWDEEKEEELAKRVDKEIKASFQKARKVKKSPIDEMFSDVYDVPSKRLLQQQQELWSHLDKYGQHYPIDNYAPSKK